MSDKWISELKDFFNDCTKALAEVLDVCGCREGWLQAEMFRWFNTHKRYETFLVNSLKIAPRKKADFSLEGRNPIGRNPIVGEIKIIGADYQNKCITGGGIKPVLNKLDAPIKSSDKKLCIGSWGLIPDFFRLINFAKGSDFRAYMVLVVDDPENACTSIAEVLRKINFIGRSTDISFVRGVVRIWRIH